MTTRSKQRHEFDALSAVGQTKMINSGNFRNSTFTLITTGFTWTIKFYASNQNAPGDTIPDLSSAASESNEYSVVQAINLQDGTTVDGNAGVALTTDTSVTRYEVNDNNNSYVGAAVTAYTAWSVKIKLDLVDNQ